MGALIPNTPAVQAATASEKLTGTLDLIEGDFLAWKEVEKKLLQAAASEDRKIIDVSSATSMNVFSKGMEGSSELDSDSILKQADSYPYLIPKETTLENLFSNFCADTLGIKVPTEEIIVLNGVFGGLRTIVQALPGTVVLVPEFTNQAQKASIAAIGKTVIEIPMFAPGWRLDLEALRAQLKGIDGKVSCMYIYHPMPAELDTPYLTELATILADHGIVPVVDLDAMKTTHTDVFEPTLPFLVPALREHGIFLFTMSKEFGAPGIRIGFGVAKKPLSDGIKKFMQQSLEMVPPTSRSLAEHILRHYDFNSAVATLQGRMRHLVDGLQSLGFEATLPHVGVNLFMHAPRAWEAAQEVLPDHLFTYYCLTRAGVVLRPASLYGYRLNHFVRFVIGQPEDEIDEMIRRFTAAGIHGQMALPDGLEKEYQESVAKL